MTAVFFFGLGTNTQIEAMNTVNIQKEIVDKDGFSSSIQQNNLPQNLQVLAPKQADLYRAVFTAQAKGDWAEADRVTEMIADRRLMGHVLADYFRRHGSNELQFQAWLKSYSDLPEASDVYAAAVSLQPAAKADLSKPIVTTTWSGAGYGTSMGFATESGAKDFRVIWVSGLRAWKRGDVDAASHIFGTLSTEVGLAPWDRAAAQFWTYRALKRAGNTQQAYYWLRQTAQQPRSFYGMLANSLLGHDDWSWQVPAFDAQKQAVLMRSAAGWRALALIQVGRSDLAEAELQRINPQGRHDVQEALLALADAAHMPALALRLGAIAVNDNGKLYDAALYPVPTWQPPKGFQVDRALLYAVMRHESQFDPMAVSERGACGLMQLMPSTANLMSHERGSSGECSDNMLDPTTNLALGQGYVKRLAAQPKIGDNLLMLLAAYNSGPNRVVRWLDDTTKRDPLLFIESLPVRETRDYMQQVLVHYVMYSARLGQSLNPLKQLARGEWPRYALHDVTPAMPVVREASAVTFKVAANDGAR
jgi:soluble lytic murein transglycosylase-like protein